MIQGTGADLTSRAFYLVSEEMKRSGLGKALFTVHDELVVMPIIGCESRVADLVLNTMKRVGEEIKLTVPLNAEISAPQRRWEDK
jgi:DNA polymerase I-like protein with 3'-5' exonuclease and polymerase domains